MFASPAALHALLSHLEYGSSVSPPWWAAPTPPRFRGALYVFVMAFTAAVQTLCIAQYFDYGYRSGMQARAAVVVACHRKCLRCVARV